MKFTRQWEINCNKLTEFNSFCLFGGIFQSCAGFGVRGSYDS